MALYKQKIEAGQVNEINKSGRHVKVVNCQSSLVLRVFSAGGELILDTEVRGGFDIKFPSFAKITIQSNESQSYELWADENPLGYDALTKGSNTNQSALIEHFGGSQKVLPFESNRVALTLFSDSERFWYGGEGVTVENGIPVQAGVAQRVEGSGEFYIAIEKKPVQILSANEVVFNNKLDVYGDAPFDYGHQGPDQTAIISTAKAQYFIESIVTGTENVNAVRVGVDGISIMNVLGKAVDMITTSYENDEIAVLLSSGGVIRYRDGVEFNRINSFSGTNWRRIGYDGNEFYLLKYEVTGVSGYDKAVYKSSNPQSRAFFSSWNYSKFYFDEYNNKLMAIVTKSGETTNIVEIAPSLSGQIESFANALGNVALSSALVYDTHVRIFQTSTHIVFNVSNGALIYNKQENRQVFSTEGRQITPIGNGLLHAVDDTGQKVSYDDGVSFTVIDDVGVPAARTYGAFIDGYFVYYSLVRNEESLYRARRVEIEKLKTEAAAKIRIMKEVV